MGTGTETTATVWQVWYRSPGERTWRLHSTFHFQVQAERMRRSITERLGDEAKVAAAPRA
jgi:hypothetical protein